MLRKFLIAGAVLLVAVIGFRAVRHSDCGGYVFSQWKNICCEARNQIPTPVELDRLQYEIAQLDRDIQKNARPLAELDFDIRQLKRDVNHTTQVLAKGKQVLQTMTAQLDKGAEPYLINKEEVNERQLKQKLGETFAHCKLLETKLSTQKQLLTAKQNQYNAIQEQANKLAAQRRQFQIQLENLRANEEQLKIERIGARPVEDNTRVNRIQQGLQEVEKRQAVEKKVRVLQQQHPFATEPQENATEPAPEINIQDVRNYIQGNAVETRTEKVSQNK